MGSEAKAGARPAPARERPEPGAPARPPVQPFGARLVTHVWHMFADPGRLGWLAVLTVLGLAVSALFSATELGTSLVSSGRGNPLLAHLYDFFELYAPWSSWWLALLVGATALAAVATAVEQLARLVLVLGGAARTEPVRTADVPARAAVHAAVALGDGARIGVAEGAAGVTVPTPRLRAALALLVAAAAVAGTAGIVERQGGLAGEMLLAPGETRDRVTVPGPGGAAASTPLGFGLVALEVNPEGPSGKLRIVESGRPVREAELSPQAPLRVGLTRIVPRAVRPAPGGERFRLRIKDKETGAESTAVVALDGTAAMEGGPTFRVDGYEADLRGLGPAVHLTAERPGAAPEPFWIFQRAPDFDANNRAARYTVSVLDVVRHYDLIVGVVRHPGIPFALGAGALLFLALVLGISGARGVPAVRILRDEVVGAPAGDARVRRAVKAAAQGEGEAP